MISKRCIAAISAASLNLARFAMAARNTSLFLTAIPAVRQRFLSVAMSAYSESGMVKLSRTSLVFLGLPGPAFLLFATSGAVTGSTFFAEFVFLITLDTFVLGVTDLIAVPGLAWTWDRIRAFGIPALELVAVAVLVARLCTTGLTLPAVVLLAAEVVLAADVEGFVFAA